jgi:hypothetical protein
MELCVASHIVNKRRYFSVSIANIAYLAFETYVALCFAAALHRVTYVQAQKAASIFMVEIP